MLAAFSKEVAMETISMSVDERRRLEVLSRVRSGELRVVDASKLLSLSYRQALRVWQRYQQEGDAGLVHKGRGRPSNRQPTIGLQEQVLSLYREHYHDYGPTLAAECLAEEQGVTVSVTTLRRWLVQAGLWERKRKRKLHRRRRERRARVGELVQLDGSHHDWFEGRRHVTNGREAYAGWAVLMVMIDDATGRVFARFYENESWDSATDVFLGYARKYGFPRGLYVDQHGIYRSDREPTAAEILAEKKPETQFGRSMRELDVKLILARSAQAKGRVERMNGTLQDRLVKAMRRAGISDLASANRYLEETFLPRFNEKFSKKATMGGNLHRQWKPELDMGRIMSFQEPRSLQNDWTIRWKNQRLQLPVESAKWVQPRDRVTVCEQLDGKLRLFVGKRELSWTETRGERPPPKRQKRRSGPTGSNQGQKPSAGHPWRGKSQGGVEEYV
jgi:transposase